MSYYPNNPYPPSPPGYHQPMRGQPSMRPTSVTVLAVLCICFGGMGAIGGLCSIVPYTVDLGLPNPVGDAVRKDSTAYATTVLSCLLSSAMGAVQLVSGVGALSLKRWARTMMLGFAVASLVATVLGAVQAFVWLFPVLDRVVGSGPNRETMELTVMITKVAAIASIVAAPILPICVLIFMNKPHVKAAFAGMGSRGA